MGRSTKPEQTPVVPINGAVYRNSSQNGLIIEATGAQYLPSTSSALLSSTDYPKYVALNSATVSALNVSVNSNASKNFGTVVYSSTSYQVNQYVPYISGTPMWSYYPFTSRTGKYRMTAMTGTNGTNTLVFQNPPGYKQSTSSAMGAAVYNATTGAFVSSPTNYPIAGWYDSSTSLFRVVGSPVTGSSQPAVLSTSSTGATWTQSSISYSVTSGFNFSAFGDSSYVKMGAVAVNQKLFVALRETNGVNQTVLYRSTNGGATITEITTNVTGGAAYYNPAGSSVCNFAMNYDGTTLFIPANTANWRWSSNDGTTFNDTTISGVTSSTDQNPAGAFSTGNNSSTFMIVYSAALTSNRVYVTTNGGQSFTTYNWTPAATLNSSYNQCPGDYDSANSRWAFVYGTSSGWYVSVSTNNGATWTQNLVQGTSIDTPTMNIVFLGGSWWVYGASAGVWRSTDAATWTQVTASASTISYGQPYMELTDYVIIGNLVIKKSDNSVTNFSPSAIISNNQGYSKNLVNYLGSDAIIQVQTQYTNYPLLVTSATAGTANNFSPYPYSQQQQGLGGTFPVDIEYWRIK